MPTPSLHELSSRLDRVFASSDTIEDDEIKSHYARYLCILTCGYLEESIKIIIRNYVAIRASPPILNHINSSTSSLTNLKTEKIGIFLNTFKSEWKDEFENSLSDEEKDSIDSVVANRHKIAHGQNVGVSYIRVKNWYRNVKRVVEKVSTIVNS